MKYDRIKELREDSRFGRILIPRGRVNIAEAHYHRAVGEHFYADKAAWRAQNPERARQQDAPLGKEQPLSLIHI